MSRVLNQYIRDAGLDVRDGNQIVLPDWVQRVKIDVGLSYSASNSIHWIRQDPQLLVFGFEPLPESCEILRKWISEQDDWKQLQRQLIILPIALGLNSGRGQLHITADDTAASSLLAPRKIEERESITVPVLPLRDLLVALPWGRIQRVDYLKLDCQGLDLQILEATGEVWLKKIAIITAEAEDDQYLDSANGLFDLVSYMKSNGFIHLNPRSGLRVYLGKMLSRLSIIRSLGISLPVKKAKEVVSSKLSVVTEDPTFVNRDFLREVMDGEITGFQRG